MLLFPTPQKKMLDSSGWKFFKKQELAVAGKSMIWIVFNTKHFKQMPCYMQSPQISLQAFSKEQLLYHAIFTHGTGKKPIFFMSFWMPLQLAPSSTCTTDKTNS